MRPDKTHIKESFSKAAATYDGNSGFQAEVADGLAVLIENILMAHHAIPACRCEDEPAGFIPRAISILDIGCGTGRLTEMLKERCAGSKIYGCDLALPMLLKAKERRTGISGLLASDCEALSFMDGTFDMAASSLTYQWSEDLKASFKEAWRVLKPGGIFVFSTLGPRTFHELKECYREAGGPGLMDFRDGESVTTFLKEAGFEVMGINRTETVKEYGSLTGLIRTLRGIGASVNAHGCEGLSGGTLIRRADSIYRKRFPSPKGGILATYEVIYAAARKA